MAKEKPKDKDKARKTVGQNCDPTILYNSYVQACKSIGIEPYNDLAQIMSTTGEQIMITGTKDDKLSSGGCRALMNALIGKLEGATTSSEPFTTLKDLRIRSSNIKDSGALAVATFLSATSGWKQQEVKSAGDVPAPQPDWKLQYLDLSQNDIRHQGALHIGRSLEVGMNKTLATLVLDFNPFGSQGAFALCKGLSTNSSLKVLSLRHCDINPVGGEPIFRSMLSFKRLAWTTLDLSGNNLGGRGLKELCSGLEHNSSLSILRLADINIQQTDEDASALETFGHVMSLNTSCLTEIDLLHNHIGRKGGKLLLPFLVENKQIKTFKISEIGMDEDTYKALFRVSDTPKSKGKTKGKKKSTKKKE